MGNKLRHNMAHTRWVLDKQGYMNLRRCTCLCARVPTRTHALTQAQAKNKYLFLFHVKKNSRKRLSVTLHV